MFMNAIASPVKQVNRIVLLDGLRGLAIFGILMVNLPIMFMPANAFMLGSQSDGFTLNAIAEGLTKFFFEGKFYVIFSLLFGYGFWLFLNKKAEEGKSMVPVFRRRVLFLFLFGALHVVLLWAGDILSYYAVFGFLLLLFRRLSNRGLIKWAVWLAIIPMAIAGLSYLMVSLASLDPETARSLDQQFAIGVKQMKNTISNFASTYKYGSFSDIVSVRLAEYRMLLPGIFFFYPVVLSMILTGVWVARKNVIARYDEHIPFFKKVFWWGLSVGILSNTLYAISHWHSIPSVPDVWFIINSVTHTIGGISLGFFYISAMVLCYAKGKEWIVNLLAPVGRMALTNYLLHSIIAAVLFHSYGFGLFGQIELWQGVLIACTIFALQIPFSAFWLKRFRFGPFEWLWRSLTYLRIQPFRA